MRKQKRKELHDVSVTGYAAEGKALARVDGKVVFIEGAVPGDRADLLLVKDKKDWAEARVLRFLEFSADRVRPFCEHFGVCGGCKWQMLPYSLQLKYKEEEVRQQLGRIGKVELPAIQPILGAKETVSYRNKLEFTFSNKRYLTHEELGTLDGLMPGEKAERFGPALGFHVPKIFDKVIDIQRCHLMEDRANGIRNFIRDHALGKGLSFYDIRSHEGWLRNLILRSCTTGELMVNLCIGYEDVEGTRSLLDALLAAFPGITSLYYTVNTKWNDSLYDLSPTLYAGKGYVTERMGELEFRIGPKSFFQTNTRQGHVLYAIVRDYAELTGRETVYDLYCGTGTIGLFLSDRASRVIGVETVAEAVADARENAAINGIDHAAFFAGDVIDICTESFFEAQGRPDVIITDPPRAGMHEKLVRRILEMEAPLVVYVSCNPATQARDLALLDEKYAVTRIQPVDMFPHTHHIENVVQLKLK
jgi:23S rRNA (uracil1939-C5)-methyltransferase